jgi:hypothetical protein
MATRTIVTCDLCKQEIKAGERVIEFQAARRQGGPIAAKFDWSEFCSEGCALAAVRGLLNGG